MRLNRTGAAYPAAGRRTRSPGFIPAASLALGTGDINFARSLHLSLGYAILANHKVVFFTNIDPSENGAKCRHKLSLQPPSETPLGSLLPRSEEHTSELQSPY